MAFEITEDTKVNAKDILSALTLNWQYGLEDDEKPSQPIQHAFDDSDSDDDAPEEVSTSASKAHMMEIYNQQKKIRAA